VAAAAIAMIAMDWRKTICIALPVIHFGLGDAA
jgi:hypothetical protein